MKTYELIFEGRLRGAIGSFYKIVQMVNAISEDKAVEKILPKYEINGFYSRRDASEYQGWTNSRTWSAAYLIQQESAAYENLTAMRKEHPVTGDDVKREFNRLNLKCDSWAIGSVNWQEIADEHYNVD